MKVDSYLDNVMKDLKRAEKSLMVVKQNTVSPSDFIRVADAVESFLQRSGGRMEHGVYQPVRSSRYPRVEYLTLEQDWIFGGKQASEVQRIADEVKRFSRGSISAFGRFESPNRIVSRVTAPLNISDADDEGLPTP